MAEDQRALLAEGDAEGDSVASAPRLADADVESQQVIAAQAFLGWSLVMTVYILTFHQTVKALDDIQMWGKELQSPLHPFRIVSLEIGVPMFFSITGRLLALEPVQSVTRWVRQMLLRVFLPGAAAIALVAVPILLVQQKLHIDLYMPDSLSSVIGDPHSWNVSPAQGWLLLLPALAVVETLNAPLLLYAETHQLAWAVLAMAMWLVVGILVHTVFGFTVLASFCFCGGQCVSFLVAARISLPQEQELKSWRPVHWIAIYILSVGVVVFQMLAAMTFRYQDLVYFARPVPALLMMTGFHSHGYFLQRLSPCIEDADADTTPGYANLRPVCGGSDKAAYAAHCEKLLPTTQMYRVACMSNFFIPAVAIISLSVGLPRDDFEYELFPMYSADGLSSVPTSSSDSLVYLGPAHVAGTWCFIHMFTGWMKAYTPDGASSAYKHATASAMVVWMFHFMFLVASVRLLKAWQLTTEGWMFLSPVVVFTAAIGGPLMIYAILQRIPCIRNMLGAWSWNNDSQGDL
mmetsp:Transcript_44222/g.102152  ORF Transcript_44222/g.102152 Transcript_44222/m.102152 type:complete len:518 (+) Transcript_44222:69-1622(+)